MTKILSCMLILFSFFSCTTPQAIKEDPELATLDYHLFIPELNGKLNEISGIIIYDSLFWGFNDSGGKNKIYGFNKAGEIQKEIEFDEAKNQDWESITQDRDHIYIGDFGNNSGGRKNLRIYKIKKEAIKVKEEQKVKSKKISFNYSEQEQFGYLNNTTPFDCEAMVEFKGSLYLFSKDWKNRTTKVYRIPTKKGEYEVSAIDTFNVNMLVTGADISPDKTKLALVGYENYQSFMWVFSNFQDDIFFKGEGTFISLNKMGNAQTEGICFYGNDSVLVSCERTSAFKQQVFLFDLTELQNGAH